MLVRPAAVLFAAATVLPAQTPPCDARNDATNGVIPAITSYGFAGPNAKAYQYTPTVPVVAMALRVYTGNTALSGDRYMALEVWDDAGGLPNARLCGGTWKIDAGLGTSWQGTNLDAVTVLLPGTSYWIVWRDPGGSQFPEEPGGITAPTALPSSTGWTAVGVAALKVRLYCTLLDDANVQQNGAACATAAGAIGTLFTNQVPQVGNAAFALEGTGFATNALSLLVLGVNPAWPSLPIPGLRAGCMLHTDDAAVVVGLTGTGNVRGPTAAGHVRYPIGIPANAALTGTYLGAQLGVFDAGSAAPLPFSASNGLRIVVQ